MNLPRQLPATPGFALTSLTNALFATVPLLASGGAAFAQADAMELEAVTVTGTRERAYRAVVAPQANKTGALARETPASVQTVTRELMEDRGVTTFGEAVRTVPGLTPQVGWGGTNDRFRLRGFATTANLKNGFRRSVFSPVDELVNIEQIEVLKGPASALYGRFEPGGVVNLVTKKPSTTPSTRFDFTLGSEDFRRATVDGTGPVSDVLSYRLTASWQDNGSFRDFAGADTKFIAPVLRWQLSPDTSVTAELEYGRKRSGFDRGFGNSPLFLNVPIHTSYGEADAYARNESRMATVTLDHRLAAAGSCTRGCRARPRAPRHCGIPTASRRCRARARPIPRSTGASS